MHIYGICRVFSEVERLKQVVDTLTEKYESKFDQPWQADYQASMLKAIVGLEIEIKDIECKFKLSQNRSEQDQQQVIKNLQKSGSVDLANAMDRHTS